MEVLEGGDLMLAWKNYRCRMSCAIVGYTNRLDRYCSRAGSVLERSRKTTRQTFASDKTKTKSNHRRGFHVIRRCTVITGVAAHRKCSPRFLIDGRWSTSAYSTSSPGYTDRRQFLTGVINFWSEGREEEREKAFLYSRICG
jgi:hypothetical protein